MTIDELKEKLLEKENQLKQIKSYVLDAIYDVKAAYNFEPSQYKQSELLAIYPDMLNKINDLEEK